MDEVALTFAKRYAGLLLIELEDYLARGQLKGTAQSLVQNANAEWELVVPNEGTTPETELEEVVWFALRKLEHLLEPNEIKLLDGFFQTLHNGFSNRVKDLSLIVSSVE